MKATHHPRVLIIGNGPLARRLINALDASHVDIVFFTSPEESNFRDLDPRIETLTGDYTDTETLELLPLAEADHLVIALAGALDSTLLVTSAIAQHTTKHIWVESADQSHSRIYNRLGPVRIVDPYEEAAIHLAIEIHSAPS